MDASNIYPFIIGSLKHPRWGFLAFWSSVGLSILGWYTPSGDLLKYAVTSVFVLIAFLILFAKLWYSKLDIYCLQKEPLSSAMAQYTQVYPITDGYAEFEVYVDIPNWLHEFDIEVDAPGYFEIGVWDTPAGVRYDDGILICKQDMPDFPFTLRFGADPGEIQAGSYNIYFRNERGKVIHRFVLDAQENLDTDFERDEVEESIAEELGFPVID